jgi:alginate O-acetyltransferase complex protein AlgI
MIFNSIPFFILFFITYILYWNVNNFFKKIILLISSILFYSYHSISLSLHFLSIILINYILSYYLIKFKKEGKDTKILINFTVIINLINLAFFKYFYFFFHSIYTITGIVSIQEFSTSIVIALPLAISFYTFQLLAFQIDIHRNKINNLPPMLDYFIFILFFPQLIAGPIMRSEEFLPKLDKPIADYEKIKNGLFLIITGLLKKVVLADNIGGIINPLYLKTEDYSSVSVMIVLFGFIIQVYCDFSGYSDIARGLANLLGFDIPHNFRGPFFASSFTEFWGRWHITLSTWLRDYLYISLGGNKDGFHRSNLNMLITMSLGGLWHGADVAYLLWGTFLGGMLAIERLVDKSGFQLPSFRGVKFFKWVFFIFLLALSGIFFRSGMFGDSSIQVINKLFYGLFSFREGKLIYRYQELLLFISMGMFLNYIEYYNTILDKFKKMELVLLPIYSIFIMILLGLFGDGGGDFIYFQF